MRVAVYTGSFNPMHKGHLAVVRHLTEAALFDCVYLIVSPLNPFKVGAISGDTARVRFEAAKSAMAKYPGLKVAVDGIELDMPAPQYTIRTLDALARREPQNDFTLVIGADNLERITSWREGERLLRDYGVAVYPRQGIDCEKLRAELLAACPEYKIEVLDAPEVDISSTEIRAAMAEGKDVSDCLI